MYDVIIVGAGPAGLSAALWLGRCCRRVAVFDSGEPRNAASRAVHGFLTRDGTPPAELRRIAREQLAPYDVTLRDVRVTDARRVEPRGFEVELADGARERARMLLLATGVSDRVPDVPGLRERYGQSVFHCPYCDGWDVRGRPLAALACGESGADFALALTTWSRDVVLFTNAGDPPSPALTRCLARHGVAVRTEPVARLEGADRELDAVVLASGERVPRSALFFHYGVDLRDDLAVRLGAREAPRGGIAAGPYEQTSVPGLYVVGDATRDVMFAVVAAGEGATAAYAINAALRREDCPLEA